MSNDEIELSVICNLVARNYFYREKWLIRTYTCL